MIPTMNRRHTVMAVAAGAFLTATAFASTANAKCEFKDGRLSSTSAEIFLTDLPLEARPGECFARVHEPARFETITEQVLVSGPTERVEVIPARYETVNATVLVKPARTQVVDVPARFEWRDQQVLTSPARSEWRRSDCNASGAVANATGECACLVSIPAQYETVRQQVLVEPATTRMLDIPAEYETVQKTVMTAPASERRISVPAQFRTVTRQVQVADARDGWARVSCNANGACSLDSMNTLRLERRLREEGYDPGLVDGVYSEATRTAMEAYQRDHELPIGSCDGVTWAALYP